MPPKGWKKNPTIVPRFLKAAITKGLRLADSIGIEAADDKTRLTITFKKSSASQPPPAPKDKQP